jgi:hypothetical protein
MKLNPRNSIRFTLLIFLMFSFTLLSTRLKADTGNCGGATTTLPFTDVMGNSLFCQIAAAYFSGLTNGTSATTYSPAQSVTREQMAAFVTRTMDQSLKRGSRRAALDQYWTPKSRDGLGLINLPDNPNQIRSDGTDLWIRVGDSNVSRVRASDGKVLETWTGVSGSFPSDLLVAKGRIFILGNNNPGTLHQIDPSQPAGTVTTLTNIGAFPEGIAFDGSRIWTANFGPTCCNSGSVSIVTLNPITVTTVGSGFNSPRRILYDGANMWVLDGAPGGPLLRKLDASGNILQTLPLSDFPNSLVFDGTNLWIAGFTDNIGDDTSSVMVVRAATGTVLATLTGNGLNNPTDIAFDGERILVTNFLGDSVSLWKASDLTPLGSVSTGAGSFPRGVCSDGLNFWITLENNMLGRF